MSTVVSECRILKCNNRNPDGTCREPTIHINTLKMCSMCNTKERQHQPRDYNKCIILNDQSQEQITKKECQP